MVSSVRAKVVETIRKAKLEARHAAEEWVKPEDNLQEHQDGDGAGQAAEASGGNSPVKSRKVQAKAQSPKKESGRAGKKVQSNRKTPKV